MTLTVASDTDGGEQRRRRGRRPRRRLRRVASAVVLAVLLVTLLRLQLTLLRHHHSHQSQHVQQQQQLQGTSHERFTGWKMAQDDDPDNDDTTNITRRVYEVMFQRPAPWRHSSVLPSWMKDYLAWHVTQRAALTARNWDNGTFRFLVVRCATSDVRCGGAADRLRPVTLLRAVGASVASRPVHLVAASRAPGGLSHTALHGRHRSPRTRILVVVVEQQY